MTGPVEFDAFAEAYEEALKEGLRYSGEDSAYFARERLRWLRSRLSKLGIAPRDVLDFGCGTGSAAPMLSDILGAKHIIGLDTSSRLLARARANYGKESVEFLVPDDAPRNWADLAYCNGVFHHIDPSQRGISLEIIRGTLKSRGLFALWENNPWNPGTRLIMRRIEFDREAITLTAPESRRLLRSVGFEVLATDSCFYFPHALSALRPVEKLLHRVPLGAQYMVLARRTA